MFEMDDFIDQFREQAEMDGEIQQTRSRDKWLRRSITFFAVIVALYTTIHGISATLHFRSQGTLGTVTGIAGIIVLEGLFLVLSHGLIHGTFKGSKVHVGLMGLATAVALVFMLANTVLDAQLNAGIALSQNMAFYFHYVLPVASVIAVVFALMGLYFAPDAERARDEAEAVDAYKKQQFNAYIAARRAELMVQKAITNAQLGARITAARTVAAHYNSDDVRKAIEGAALSSIPHLLRQIGVNPADVPDVNNNGVLDHEDVAAYLPHPSQSEPLPPPTQPVGTPIFPSFPHELKATDEDRQKLEDIRQKIEAATEAVRRPPGNGNGRPPMAYYPE